MEKKITYCAKGWVLGNYWGGGRGAYPTIKLTGESITAIRDAAQHALSTGSLDSGMGYESLIGALLEVEIRTEIVIGDKTYINREHEEMFVGELSESNQEFLYDCLRNSG